MGRLERKAELRVDLPLSLAQQREIGEFRGGAQSLRFALAGIDAGAVAPVLVTRR
jgi:hypothetical protein